MKPVSKRAIPAFAAMASMAVSFSARADEAGLPQLDTTTFPEQLFWLTICFSLLYLLMSKVAMPKIDRTQVNRRQVIEGELEAARQANEAAKQSVAAVEKSLAAARAQAQAGVSEMLARVAADAGERNAAQEHDLGKQLNRAEVEIATVRETALKAVRASAGDLSAAVIDKILGSKARAA